MTKARSPLSLHGVIDRAFEEVGGKDEVLTILPHRKRKWLYDAVNPEREAGKEARVPYDDVRALTRAGSRAFAEDLARLSGMALVPLAEVERSEAERAALLQRKGAALMAGAGGAVADLIRALEDGRIDARETEALSRQMIEIKTLASRMLEVLAMRAGSGDGHDA